MLVVAEAMFGYLRSFMTYRKPMLRPRDVTMQSAFSISLTWTWTGQVSNKS